MEDGDYFAEKMDYDKKENTDYLSYDKSVQIEDSNDSLYGRPIYPHSEPHKNPDGSYFGREDFDANKFLDDSY